MPRSFSVCWVGVCVLSMLLTAPISADDLDYISVEGAINDISQQRIVNARVTAKATSTAQERTTTSDTEGRYRFTKLLPGEYELRVEVSGFRTVQYKFNAAAGIIVRRDFKLEVAALNEQITVESASDQITIDTSRTVVGSTITKRQIDDLPTESRNINDLIFTLPGVAPPAFDDRQLAEGDTKDRFRSTPEEAGVFAMNGGLPFSNNLTIEGLDNNDDRGARERFTPSIDAVEVPTTAPSRITAPMPISVSSPTVQA